MQRVSSRHIGCSVPWPVWRRPERSEAIMETRTFYGTAGRGARSLLIACMLLVVAVVGQAEARRKNTCTQACGESKGACRREAKTRLKNQRDICEAGDHRR